MRLRRQRGAEDPVGETTKKSGVVHVATGPTEPERYKTYISYIYSNYIVIYKIYKTVNGLRLLARQRQPAAEHTPTSGGNQN